MSAEPTPVSFKLRARHAGIHWHVAVWSSEYGTDTTHGRNGILAFREAEWLAFRHLLLTAETSSPLEITEEEVSTS